MTENEYNKHQKCVKTSFLESVTCRCCCYKVSNKQAHDCSRQEVIHGNEPPKKLKTTHVTRSTVTCATRSDPRKRTSKKIKNYPRDTEHCHVCFTPEQSTPTAIKVMKDAVFNSTVDVWLSMFAMNRGWLTKLTARSDTAAHTCPAIYSPTNAKNRGVPSSAVEQMIPRVTLMEIL